VHCVVPGGGLSPNHQRWISTNHPRFLLPIAVLHDVFRDKFLAGLRHLYRKNQLDCRGAATDFCDPAWFEQLIARLGKKDWYVYAKPPFGGPDRVLAYLGRYTHRMAISNHRLVSFDGEEVRFRWRDHRHGGIQRVMPLGAVEFLRRFFLHVLPRGLHKVRYYGLWNPRQRDLMQQVRLMLQLQRPPEPPQQEPAKPPMAFKPFAPVCPRCGGQLAHISEIARPRCRGP